MLYPGPEAAAPPRVESLLTGLRSAGYLAPAQIELVLRVTNGDPARISPMVAEIIASNVDVLFAVGPAVLRTALAARSPARAAGCATFGAPFGPST